MTLDKAETQICIIVRDEMVEIKAMFYGYVDVFRGEYEHNL